ncbi:MAG TPA: SH3 domain-containing protein [Anaerolineaceae bacterium]|nr:SH3 domain-containing protein [Anaerolineaceae bacterium]
MTLPADNPEPNRVQNFENLPPRKMSLVLQDANPEELNFFTNLLAEQNQINPGYYLMVSVSLVAIVLGLIFNSYFLAMLAALVAPLALPFIGVAVHAAKPSFKSVLLMLLHLLITALLYYFGGRFAALLTRAAPDSLPLSFLIENHWIYWVGSVAAAALTGFFQIRQSEARRLSSALLTALTLLPLALIGWRHQANGFQTVDFLLPGIRILLALYALCMAFWFSHLPPRKTSGWGSFLLVTFGLVTLFVLSIQNTNQQIANQTINTEQPTPISGLATAAPISAVPTAAPIIINRPTELVFTIVPSNTPTLPPTATQTPEPTSTSTPAPIRAYVVAVDGMYVRTEPSLSSGYVDYLPYDTIVTLLNEIVTADDLNWAKVLLEDGQIGWTLADFLEPITN